MAENQNNNFEIFQKIYHSAEDILQGMNKQEREPYDQDINNLENNLKSEVSQKLNLPIADITRKFLLEHFSDLSNLKGLNIPIPPRILELILNAATKAGVLDKLLGFVTKSGNSELINGLVGKAGGQGAGGAGDLLSGLMQGGGAEAISGLMQGGGADAISGLLNNKEAMGAVGDLLGKLGKKSDN